MTLKLKTKKEQKRDAELRSIIQDMSRAMWNADKRYIAHAEAPLTISMNTALIKFQNYCMRYHG